MRILFIGGTFDDAGGSQSGLVSAFSDYIKNEMLKENDVITICNGGPIEKIPLYLQSVADYDAVFWWANVPNDFPKMRNIKEIAPKTLLVSSKRNRENKYSFQELINHALGLKANLTVEFYDADDLYFGMRTFDPLGTVWYEGLDIKTCAQNTYERLLQLKNFTRQGTIPVDDPAPETKNDMTEFIDVVKMYGNTFHELICPAKKVTRYLGNASFRPTNFRCTKGFPSFRNGDYIFVSQRNVDKERITLKNFVATKFEDGKIFYHGNKKPSVDTPVQLRLYNQLPQINYMVHAHCYIKDAPFTNSPVPCGAIEEIEEVMNAIKKNNLENSNHIAINLIGHGCIVMSSDVDGLRNVKFKARELPERINN